MSVYTVRATVGLRPRRARSQRMGEQSTDLAAHFAEFNAAVSRLESAEAENVTLKAQVTDLKAKVARITSCADRDDLIDQIEALTEQNERLKKDPCEEAGAHLFCGPHAQENWRLRAINAEEQNERLTADLRTSQDEAQANWQSVKRLEQEKAEALAKPVRTGCDECLDARRAAEGRIVESPTNRLTTAGRRTSWRGRGMSTTAMAPASPVGNLWSST